MPYLFSAIDTSLSEDDDAEFSIDFDDLGDAIRIAWMIDVARQTAR